MKNTRIITVASILIGFCVGVIIKAYIDNPGNFAFMDHLALLCIIVSMALFIIGHLKVESPRRKRRLK